jgi:hypothetical protein
MRIVLALFSLLTALPATAQDMTYDQLEDLTRTRFASLTAHLPITSPPTAAPCDRSTPGQTHVILLGAEDFGPLNDVVLQGTRASIDLIGQSLVTRGVKAENITPLTGPYANRATLTLAVDTLLAKLTCTDTALLYITGVSANTQSISMVMTDGIYEDDWISGLSDRFPIMRAITDASPFMVLNPSNAAQEELISAAAVSEIVTLLRNRAGHVAVVIDTTYAAAFDLSARQMAADARLMWKENLSVDPSYAEAPTATPLSPQAGEFSVLYGAQRTSMAAEMTLPLDDPDATVYSLFAFKLAAALGTDPTLTLPSLGRTLSGLSLDGAYAEYQNHQLETTDAGLSLLAELTTPPPTAPEPEVLPGPADVVLISSPEPTRSAVPLDIPRVTVKGQVEWPEDTLIVLVNRQQALSRPSGEFEQEIELTEGLNQIEIVALTRDNRQHRKVIEVSYAGDTQALLGQGRSYALLIANQTYPAASGMPPLATPFADVDAIAGVLTTKYGFQTTATLPDGTPLPLILKDATRAQIESTLFQLSRVAGEKDRVLVWYGGHGIFEQMTDTAFWVPADAIAGVPPSYLSASAISEALLRFQAGSVIVVSDSCYSGALLRGADSNPQTEADRDRMLQRLAAKRSRVLITSGANEPVADGGGDGHSVFARAFLTALTEADGPLTAQELFDGWVRPMVIGRADQEPQFRPIAKSGHEGGDFIFLPTGG